MRKVPRILCERYELHDVLGKGAHGRIYLATDLVTHDKVAIKMVSRLFILLIKTLIDGEIEQEQVQVPARNIFDERYDEVGEAQATE